MTKNNSISIESTAAQGLLSALDDLDAEARNIHYFKLAGIVNITIFKEFESKLFELRKKVIDLQPKKEKTEKKRMKA